MVTFEADGRKIEAKQGETILLALRREGIHVPTLCHMDGLAPSGACRLCVVEVEGTGQLVTACSSPITDGMKIQHAQPARAGSAADDRGTAALQPPR